MVFQSFRKKRSEDYDTWSERYCSKKSGEDEDTCCEGCYCNMRIEDAALRGWRKKRRRDDDVSRLNDDLLEEIMLRLPVKALTRFQVVSKHWRRMINSKYFKDRHMLHQKTTQEPKFLCLHEASLDLTLTTMRLDWSSTSCLVEEGPVYHIKPQIDQMPRVSGSCDGLVCIFDDRSLTSPIVVANPAMVRSQTLPLSEFQLQCLEDKKNSENIDVHFPGFGKDDVTGTYKLVWLHNNERNYTLSCEVFDFEVKKWRYVMNTPCDVHANEEPIFAKGWLYWIIENRTYEYKILGYNIHTEMFRVFTNKTVSEAASLSTVTMCTLSDRIWVTNDLADGDGMQHFWRIKNILDSEWESEKMFFIDPKLISPWFPDMSTFLPFITLKATSNTTRKKNFRRKEIPGKFSLDSLHRHNASPSTAHSASTITASFIPYIGTIANYIGTVHPTPPQSHSSRNRRNLHRRTLRLSRRLYTGTVAL
ncbi:unnamed protein product [Eruca vesicaria subsp. sativa]|uniref:F-box domain-containing protein n=1 Tax=Eruca vesicaria subsp. sativa TaxID=29727 RepID=A0ABC8LWG4_ERUVS|nr:unnamed protein product [Eruca vesicaria subsp. sativa]